MRYTWTLLYTDIKPGAPKESENERFLKIEDGLAELLSRNYIFSPLVLELPRIEKEDGRREESGGRIKFDSSKYK